MGGVAKVPASLIIPLQAGPAGATGVCVCVGGGGGAVGDAGGMSGGEGAGGAGGCSMGGCDKVPVSLKKQIAGRAGRRNRYVCVGGGVRQCIDPRGGGHTSCMAERGTHIPMRALPQLANPPVFTPTPRGLIENDQETMLSVTSVGCPASCAATVAATAVPAKTHGPVVHHAGLRRRTARAENVER